MQIYNNAKEDWHKLPFDPPGEVEDLQAETQQDGDVFSPTVPSPYFTSGPPLKGSGSGHGRSISISVVPCSNSSAEEANELSCYSTAPVPKLCSLKASHTPPPPSRKLLHLLPNIVLTRSKSQESQLANRVEEPAAHRWVQPVHVSRSFHLQKNESKCCVKKLGRQRKNNF